MSFHTYSGARESMPIPLDMAPHKPQSLYRWNIGHVQNDRTVAAVLQLVHDMEGTCQSHGTSFDTDDCTVKACEGNALHTLSCHGHLDGIA